jgi:hypothetical protein
MTNSGEYEERPFPSKRINRNAKRKPPDQLEISEEVEGSSRSESFDKASHVNPPLHPESLRPSERIRQEHQEDSSIDSNVPIANGADRIDILEHILVKPTD